VAAAAWLKVSAGDAAPPSASPATPPAAVASPEEADPDAATAPFGVTEPAGAEPAPGTPTVTTRPVPIPSRMTPRPGSNTPPRVQPARPATGATVPVMPPMPNANRTAPRPAPATTTPAGSAGSAASPASAGDSEDPTAALSAILPPPGAADRYNPDRVLPAGTVWFQASPLEQVLTFYAELSGRTILRPSALPDTAITLKTQTELTTREALEAIDSVLALNDITMIPTGKKFVTAIPSNQVTQEAPEFVDTERADLPEASQYITKLVTLEHVLPSEAVELIQGFSKVSDGIVALDESKTLVLRDYAANIKRMMEILERVDVERELDYSLEVIPIKYGKVDEIYATMSSLISGGGGVATGTASTGNMGGFGNNRFGGSSFGGSMNSGFGGGSSRFGGGYGSSYGGIGGGIGGYRPYAAGTGPADSLALLDAANPGNYQPYQVSTGPATSRGSTTSFNQRLQNIVRRASGQEEEVQILEDARIVPDQRSNSLIVFASKQDMTMITNIVAKVDRLLAQVLIEATIMDVNLTDEFELGVSTYLNDQSGKWRNDMLTNPGNIMSGITNITGGGSGGLTWLGNYDDKMNVLVQAIASTGKGQIMATPRIQTSHAMQASFTVGETVPYVSATFGSTFVGPSSSFSQLPVFSTLQVIPYITPDGLVVMDISQDIQEVSGFKQFEGVGEMPQTVNRSAQSTVSVRDGDTIILGGYVRMNRSRNNSGVPILKDIPLLGALFRSKSNKSARTEMVVFIRPTVLPTPTDAARFADGERTTMPGISQMDRLMKEDQEKLRKATDRLDRSDQKP
jgi:type II secretory pathway component GspD/PulD (secretin)